MAHMMPSQLVKKRKFMQWRMLSLILIFSLLIGGCRNSFDTRTIPSCNITNNKARSAAHDGYS